MSEVVKDYAIKLFGKTIDLLPYRLVPDTTVPEQIQSSFVTSTSEDSKDSSGEEFTGSRHEYESTNPTEETLTEATTTTSETSNSPCPKKHSSSHSKEEPSESSASQEKTVLKKPDKILPCPRCESTDTKFCYYNNYNVNQPRYFCRNCQRYWTSGGTMRNVPIGSGRRKNKNLVSVQNYPLITREDLSSLKYPNGFLFFGQDESMNPRLNLVERSQNCTPNEVYEGSSRSSSAHSNPTEKGSRPPEPSASGFPVTFYPAMPYWGYALPSSWNVPLFSTTASSALGKHSREETMMIRPSNLGKDQNPSERRSVRRSVLIPKTLRIDDPDEAAKSSVWSTLGIKNEKIGSVNGACRFKAFEPKGHRHRSMDSTTMVLQANPAALSRSLNFHESA